MALHRRNGKGLRGRRMAGVVERLEERRLLAVTPGGGWSSYLGGGNHDIASSVAVDGSGNVYVAGGTDSAGWARGGFDTSQNGGQDGFVAKIGPNGTMAWSTYLGGASLDFASAVAVDALGNVYAVGYTDSSEGMLSGGPGNWDGFLVKINADGALVWSTYLGGDGQDWASSLALDGAGNVYVTGTTGSPGWIPGSNDHPEGGYDGFVVKVRADGSRAWSMYLGDSSADPYAVAVDSSGSVYVAGGIWAAGGTGGDHSRFADAFVTGISADGKLVWSTYLGGDDQELANSLAVDGEGSVYVAGTTYSPGWVSGGFDTSYQGSQDAFVAKLRADRSLAWSSYLGGSDAEVQRGLATDRDGNVYVAGGTYSTDLMAGAFGSRFNSDYDAFVAKVSPDGLLVWVGYVGGVDADWGSALAIDGSGNAYVAGLTRSSGWAYGGPDTSYGGGEDGFVAKLAALEVRGTEGADSISVDVSGSQYVVTVSGWSTTYEQNLVASLSVYGMGGNDTITISPRVTLGVSIYAGTGDDSVMGGGGADLIEGGEGNDTLLGMAGNDTIYGHDGADRIYGYSGDDELYGNGGNDTVRGGDGNDLVYGQAGDDALNGDDGNDTVRGALGRDVVAGGYGDDNLYGGDGSDTIWGYEGNDYVEGRGKADTIYGGIGNDTIYGGAGADWIAGEDGEDWIDVGVSVLWHDSVDGGAGRDTVRADGDDLLSGVEVVLG